jgi:hypothetical protein
MTPDHLTPKVAAVVESMREQEAEHNRRQAEAKR